MGELVSIIMPSFNAARFLPQAIESVIAQTYSDWQLVVCDDGSTDKSSLIAMDYASKDSRIKCIQNKYRKGAPGARNSALDFATGRYIAFLDSDDAWYPDKLEKQIFFMEHHEIALCYSYHDVMDEHGAYVGSYRAPAKVNSNLMKISNFIPCLTAIYDTKILGKIYQPDIKKRNDFALWLKILNGGQIDSAYCFPTATAKYRVNSYGLSSNKADSLFFFRRCLMDYGRCTSLEAICFSFIYLALMVIKKKFLKLYNKLVVVF